MRKATIGTSWLVLTYSAALGQPSFEVASVKPAAPPRSNTIVRMSGGPGTADPGLFTSNVTLKALLLRAYGLKSYQISGPGWLDSAWYDIRANVPPGATKEQFDAMLRNLLAERFNLTLHHEAKDLAVYELAVGKSGPKLHQPDLNVRQPTLEPGAPPPPLGVSDKDGFLQIPPGTSLILGTTRDGVTRWTARIKSLSDLVSVLEDELARPVVDKTGLTAKYDFNLAYSRDGLIPRGRAAAPDASPSDPSGGPSLLDAVQDQLGLTLVSRRDPIDILVLDHVDKVPTGN